MRIIERMYGNKDVAKCGAAGGGRVFFTRDGLLDIKFTSGLGIDSNNMTEALALWQGLRIAKEMGISKLNVIGDSIIIICALAENLMPNNMALRHLIQKIVVQTSSSKKINFYHVLRENNSNVDYEANKGTSLCHGELILNNQGSFYPPP